MQRNQKENPQFNIKEHVVGRTIVRSLIEGLAQQEEATTFVEDTIGVLSDPVVAEKLFYLLPLKDSRRIYPQVDRDKKELTIGFHGGVYPTSFGRGLAVLSFADAGSVTYTTRVLSRMLEYPTVEHFQKDIDEVFTPSGDQWEIKRVEHGRWPYLVGERPFNVSDIVSEASRVQFFTGEVQSLADDIYTAATRIHTPMQYRRLIHVFTSLKE